MTRLPAQLLAFALVIPMQAMAQSLTSSKAEERAPQKSGRERPVPKQYLPPSGMCRIWVDNVPAARQPAPTDCATAIRNRPPNARVVFPAGKDRRAREPNALAPGKARTDTTKRKPPA